MTFIKQTLRNIASLTLAIWIVATAYATLTTVSSGDPLTADSWNAVINKINSTNTNSNDLVTKSYVDSAILASNWTTFPNINNISQKSSSKLGFIDALDYCRNLNESWFNDWRVPSSKELLLNLHISNQNDYIWTISRSPVKTWALTIIRMSDWYINDWFSSSGNFYTYCVR